jgi:hypothetical protein
LGKNIFFNRNIGPRANDVTFFFRAHGTLSFVLPSLT